MSKKYFCNILDFERFYKLYKSYKNIGNAKITNFKVSMNDKEYTYNKEFGAYMKGRVDDVILVGRLQTKAIVDGLKENENTKKK